MNSLKILHVAAELSPFVQVGGLAEVVAALQSNLCQQGHDVRVLIPFYSQITALETPPQPVPGLEEFDLGLGDQTFACSVYETRARGGEGTVYLLKCDALYGRREIYSAASDEPLRFALLSQVALTLCDRLNWVPDVFHSHDWHAALLPLQLRKCEAKLRPASTVLTVHNLGYQGEFDLSWSASLGLGSSATHSGMCNFLSAGLESADLLTTVSPTYAKEIQGRDQGHGLDEVLQRRAGRLRGILNGIDTHAWDPQEDPMISANYSADDLSGKDTCRNWLLENFDLALPEGAGLVGVVSRLVHQKGFDLILEEANEFLRCLEIGLVILGTGEPRHESRLRELADMYPQQVSFTNDFDLALAHRIEAGADIFAMPSRYEPCGLNQMYSLRYGTVPLARRTGGLADSIEEFDPSTGEGTGFTFEEPTAEAFRHTLERCLATYREPGTWNRLMRNGMTKDFSWEGRVPQYLAAYREAIQLREGALGGAVAR